ncbi:MAG TPA: cytochrome c oxidase subunit II [Thermodesulfobacteriota bacterium]|nr:cytochrome c oxidase subunit II [Thermodesulfobacteriota bacterium]
MIFSAATGISGRVVDNVFLYIVTICIILLALITFLMVYFVVRYRREKHAKPVDIEGSTWLEITWTVIPTLIVLTMFYYGLTGFEFLKKVPPGAMTVKVIARQWSWLFQYENGIQDTELRVPVGKPVKLRLNSLDVIHGFYIPAFRIKQDVVPGMTNTLWFQPTQIGTYDIMCSQYCGLEHSHMLSKMIVLPEEQFTNWYQGKKKEATAKGLPQGSHLYEVKGCVACHSTDGSPRVGPTFKGLLGKKEEATSAGKKETVVVDEAFVRKFISEPNVVHIEGYPPIMPKIGMTNEELTALVDYIKSLR